MEPPDTWGAWSNHVLAELKRAHEEREDLRRILTDVRVELATLKVRASIWGGLSGFVVAIVTAIAQVLGVGAQ